MSKVQKIVEENEKPEVLDSIMNTLYSNVSKEEYDFILNQQKVKNIHIANQKNVLPGTVSRAKRDAKSIPIWIIDTLIEIIGEDKYIISRKLYNSNKEK